MELGRELRQVIIVRTEFSPLVKLGCMCANCCDSCITDGSSSSSVSIAGGISNSSASSTTDWEGGDMGNGLAVVGVAVAAFCEDFTGVLVRDAATEW